MKTNVYTIYDTVAEEAGPLYQAKNHGVARRNVDHALKTVDNPDEYSLLCLGIMDTTTASFKPHKKPEVVDIADLIFTGGDQDE